MKKITLLIVLLAISFGYAQSIPVDFESDIILGDNWKEDSGMTSVAVVDDSFGTGHGKIGQMTSSSMGNPWQNAQLRLTTNYLDLTDATGSKIITLDVYATSAQDFLLKIEQPLNGTGSLGYSQMNFSHNGAGWQTINVDFTTPEGGDVPNDQYKLLVVFPTYSPGFANPAYDVVNYIDNVTGTVGDAVTPPMPNFVTVDVASNWVGYMNWFFTPADGGAWDGGSAWGVADLKTVIGASNITLQPNFNLYGDGSDAYWANGAIGNKMMEASTFVEPGSTFNGVDLTFTGNVVSHTIAAGYTAEFFIKALDPGAGYADALNGSKVVTLPTSGEFTVTATGAELASGLIIQYGFRIYGLNANPADEATLGSVVVEAVSLSTNDIEVNQLKVYPNPTQNVWNIKTNNSTINSIQVFDVLGQQVISLNPNSEEAEINASGLSTGMYIAKISTPQGERTIRLVRK